MGGQGDRGERRREKREGEGGARKVPAVRIRTDKWEIVKRKKEKSNEIKVLDCTLNF